MENPAAWHPDPTGRHEHRWWDGERWTEHVADGGQSSTDPLDAGGAAAGGQDQTSSASSAAETSDGAASPNSGTESTGSAADPGSGTPQPGAGAGDTGGGWATPAAGHTGGQAGNDQPTTPQQGWSQPQGGDAGVPQQGAWGQTGATPPGGQPGWGQPTGQAGWQQQQQWPQAAPVNEPPRNAGTSGMAVTAMILGILSLVFFWVPILGGLGAVIAVVLGFIGRSSAKKRGVGGAGMALAGIITGFLALAGNILLTIWLATAGGWFFEAVNDYTQCMEIHNDQEYCDAQLEENVFDWLD